MNFWDLRKIHEQMSAALNAGAVAPNRYGKKPIRFEMSYDGTVSYSVQSHQPTDPAEQLKFANEELSFNLEEKEKLSSDLLSANMELAEQNGEIQKRTEELLVAHVELAFQDGEKEKRAAELVVANQELAFQKKEKKNRAAELLLANRELVYQNGEKEKRAAELTIVIAELAFQNTEKEKRAQELAVANEELHFQNTEKEKRAKELDVANKELMFQNKEKEKRAAELSLANIELAYQSNEKGNRAAELIVANAELAFQNAEKEKRAMELAVANKELTFQNSEKEKRAKELAVANRELMFQNKEKEKRAAELTLANIDLAYENIEKEHRAAELIVANKELAFQNSEKENRAKELAIANAELTFQNSEKENRAKEFAIANKELLFQNKEKEKRAAELSLANIELAYQNNEKEQRAAELVIANTELAYQNEEKDRRAQELVVANRELAYQNEEKEMRVTESVFLSNHDHLTGLNNRRSYEEELVTLDRRENLPITIVMGDINGLKMINDSFGHNAGDMLLKLIAAILQRTSRPADLVARIGGDEFVLVLPKTDENTAEQIIGQIKKTLLNDPSNQLRISASFGHETKTSMEEDIQELFQSAENQMYRHKLTETGSMRSQTIDLIMHTLFAKNPREAKHSERVGFICERIAVFLELGESIIHDMRIAGMMHDIGKIGIGETILNKAGRLTEDEWIQMKKHPEIGYRILSTTQEFSMIADFILQHHERWNGCGYPKGLKAGEILRQARIIAIADSYDAMTSERTYQARMTDEQALREIEKNAGTLYDPEIVRVFVERHAELNA